MNYKIVENGILETQTGEILYRDEPVETLKEVIRGLNFGKAFDGFTPTFFLQKWIPSSS